MTSVPHQDEPDIYESLADALIAASTAYLDADPYYEAGMTHLRQASELDQKSEELAVQAGMIMEQAYTLFSEYCALTGTDPQQNIDQARELMVEIRDLHRQERALRGGAAALGRQSLSETMQGMEIRAKGHEALRTGLERAATLLQQARRRPTNGDTPDTLAA